MPRVFTACAGPSGAAGAVRLLVTVVPLGAAATAVWVAYRLNERRYRDR